MDLIAINLFFVGNCLGDCGAYIAGGRQSSLFVLFPASSPFKPSYSFFSMDMLTLFLYNFTCLALVFPVLDALCLLTEKFCGIHLYPVALSTTLFLVAFVTLDG